MDGRCGMASGRTGDGGLGTEKQQQGVIAFQTGVPMPALHDRRPAAPKPASNGSLTSSQKAVLMLGAVLVGPAMLKKFYEKPDKVDLTGMNIVTHYETPAIEKMDSTVRIEFCSS